MKNKIVLNLLCFVMILCFTTGCGQKGVSDNGGNVDGTNGNNGAQDNSLVYSTCAREGNKCTDDEIYEGQLVKVFVNETTSFDFYVINDDGTNLTLLKNGSLGDSVEWISDDDLENVFSFTNGNPNNSYGPYTALTYLNELTKDWSNIDLIGNYDFLNPSPYGDDEYLGLNIKNGIITLTSNNSVNKIVPGEARARLMTLSEIKFINDISAEHAEWLYNKLEDEYDNDNSSDPYEHVAYSYFWLLDSATTSSRAGGANSIFGVTQINVESIARLYPVITVRKSQIK